MSFLEDLPKPFIALAPMDDVTDSVFRQIVAGCAKPDVMFTEFVNVDGLQSPGRPKLMHKLKLTDKEKPVIAQIWGLNPDNYKKTAAELKEMGFAGVDINMGCPVKTVVKHGACAALIKNPELAEQIIDAVREGARSTSSAQAGDDFPVSVKTRVGFTTVDMDWIAFLLGKKLNMLTIHGRTAKQMSKVPADWELIGEVARLRDEISPSTLIVGNGDILTYRQGLDLATKYKLDGVMIGRGIFHDPYIFSKNSPWAELSQRQKLDLFKKHIALHIETYKDGERKFELLRKFCKVYINGFDGASELRAKFMEASSSQEALGLLDGLQKTY